MTAVHLGQLVVVIFDLISYFYMVAEVVILICLVAT